MTQGSLDGNLITCAWHNWKFRVDDGACVVGEEDITTHPATDRRRRHGAGHAAPTRPRGTFGRGCWPACAGASNGTTSVRSAATWCGCCRPTPTRVNWSGRRSTTAHRGPSSAGGIRSPRPPTAWRWSTCTRATSEPCRSCRRSPASPRPNAIGRSIPLPDPVDRPSDRPARRVPSTPSSPSSWSRRRRWCAARSTPATPRATCGRGSRRSPAIICCRTATAPSTARRRSSCST